jgi:hypothetical protein
VIFELASYWSTLLIDVFMGNYGDNYLGIDSQSAEISGLRRWWLVAGVRLMHIVGKSSKLKLGVSAN